MKRLYIFTAILLLSAFFASNVSAQDKDCKLLEFIYYRGPNLKIEHKGDVTIRRNETEDYKYASIEASKVIFEKKSETQCGILEINFYTSFKGTTFQPTDKINLYFESISNKYLFDAEADRKLVLQADDEDVFSTTLKQKRRDAITKTIKRENLPSDVEISFAMLKRLAKAQKVTIKLGKRVFLLTDSQQQAIVDFYKTLDIPDKDTA
jgi:hypothetical protein